MSASVNKPLIRLTSAQWEELVAKTKKRLAERPKTTR